MGMSVKHLHRYTAEFEVRYNQRPPDKRTRWQRWGTRWQRWRGIWTASGFGIGTLWRRG